MPSRPQIFHARPRSDRATLNAEYDDRRGSSTSRGYNGAWDKASADFKRANPLCIGCQAIGRIMASEVTDHVEPHKGNPVKFWNAELWQPACRWHHDQVKQILERRFARGELKLADLWLNSKAAIAVTLSLLPLVDREDGGGCQKSGA